MELAVLCFMLLDTSATDVPTHFTLGLDMYLFGHTNIVRVKYIRHHK